MPVPKVDTKSGKTIAPKIEANGMKLSFFEDDEGDNLFTGVVLLEGRKIFVRDLTKAERDELAKKETEVQKLLEQVADSESEEVDIEDYPVAQIGLYDWVIERCVGNWELTRPNGQSVDCTTENKKKLHPTWKATLYDSICQRSSLGRDVSSFLSRL